MAKKCGNALAFCEDAGVFCKDGRAFCEDDHVFYEDALAFCEDDHVFYKDAHAFYAAWPKINESGDTLSEA